jgi:hypothetical protein
MSRRFRDTNGKRTISIPEIRLVPRSPINRVRAGIPVMTPAFILRYFTSVDDTTDYLRDLSDDSLVLNLADSTPIQVLP